VYRDPIHDFGILRFDPKAIKYMPVAALELRPDLARKTNREKTFMGITTLIFQQMLARKSELSVTMLERNSVFYQVSLVE
jgi:hypothetical protein